jgi:predicted glycoside hydrolase/deacetylase ChbG (UPF0249 family)
VKKKLIITADDYGFTPGVNKGIEACIHLGFPFATCVMTNMPFWRTISSVVRDHPTVSYGIHWCVTQGSSVSPVSQVPTLVDSDGKFYDPSEFRLRVWKGQIDLVQLEVELAAQLDLLRTAVPEVIFWNTHQNVHVTWWLYRIFARTAKRLGLTTMRNHQRVLARSGKPALPFYLGHPIFWGKGLILNRWAARARTFGMNMPIGIIADVDSGPGHMNVCEALDGTEWEGTAELAIHPAADLNGLAGRTVYQQIRVEEYNTFSNSSLYESLVGLGVQLVNFDELKADTRTR